MKYLGLWSPELRNFFEKFVNSQVPPSTYLMHAPLQFVQCKILKEDLDKNLKSSNTLNFSDFPITVLYKHAPI